VPAGDEGGFISGGTTNFGVTDLGDEDIWSFMAFKSNTISLNCLKLGGTGSYFPWMRLYGPGGALLTNAGNSASISINYTPTNSGTFTVLVGSYFLGQAGTYNLSGSGFSTGLQLRAPSISGTNLTIAGTGGGSNVLYCIHGNKSGAAALGPDSDEPIRCLRWVHLHKPFQPFSTSTVLPLFRALNCGVRRMSRFEVTSFSSRLNSTRLP